MSGALGWASRDLGMIPALKPNSIKTIIIFPQALSQSVWADITQRQTRWLGKKRNLFLTVLEAESPRSGASVISFCEGLLLGCRLLTSHCVLTCWEG